MPHGLTAIKMGTKIVPVRNFGEATHMVVALIGTHPKDICYLPIDKNEFDDYDFASEQVHEIIYCSEFDWYRLKLKMRFYDHALLCRLHKDYEEHDDYYSVCRTVPNGGVSEYSDFIKKHY